MGKQAHDQNKTMGTFRQSINTNLTVVKKCRICQICAKLTGVGKQICEISRFGVSQFAELPGPLT
jgi:hypothetical protein